MQRTLGYFWTTHRTPTHHSKNRPTSLSDAETRATVEKFLSDFCLNRPELLAALKSYLCLCLMDDIVYKLFVVFINKPGGGKTSMMNFIRLLGGGRAYSSDSSFLVNAPPSSFNETKANAMGTSWTCKEPQEGRKLILNTLKELTGGEEGTDSQSCSPAHICIHICTHH
eukprot:COSAG01_NODE_5481_length_4231_cov_3.053969_3_plen_169_part_00